LSEEEMADESESRRVESTAAATTLDLKQISRNAAERAERELIRQVLLMTNWNRRRAAHLLQVSRKTLWQRIRRYDLDTVRTTSQELSWRKS